MWKERGARLFTFPYFVVRSSGSSALGYGRPSWFHMYQGAGRRGPGASGDLTENQGTVNSLARSRKSPLLTPFTVAHKHEPQPTEFFVHHFSTSATDNDAKEYSAMNRISEYSIVNIPRPIFNNYSSSQNGLLTKKP